MFEGKDIPVISQLVLKPQIKEEEEKKKTCSQNSI
jgi:hypothetical protein